LLHSLKQYSNVAVAFSGGVDSSLLLYAACEALGKEHVHALRGVSELVSHREMSSAVALLGELEISNSQIQEIRLHPLNWAEFVVNSKERCYFCKKRMYHTFQQRLESLNCAVLLDGSNVDDLKSHRPGFRAIHEFGIKTPLLDSGLTKKEIRSLAKTFRLSVHDKPSNSCLATRLPVGKTIEKDSLLIVEKCEDFLLEHDFVGCRVRPNGLDVVLELAENDLARVTMMRVRTEIIHFFKELGFLRILVDLSPRF
jgi:pyridinium-3,5-biscarboxylic acid mononucleotide sulfurtransferase